MSSPHPVGGVCVSGHMFVCVHVYMCGFVCMDVWMCRCVSLHVWMYEFACVDVWMCGRVGCVS